VKEEEGGLKEKRGIWLSSAEFRRENAPGSVGSAEKDQRQRQRQRQRVVAYSTDRSSLAVPLRRPLSAHSLDLCARRRRGRG